MADWLWLLSVVALLASVHSLPTGLDDAKKTEQHTRPKVKRSQETLMFGYQQNHQALQAPENDAANNLEKRTLSNSGLDDTLSEQQQQPEPKALPSTYLTDQLPQRDRSYEYGKVLVNENEDEPQQRARAWNLPYAGVVQSREDRRKRSHESSSTSTQPAAAASSTSSAPPPSAPVTAVPPSGAAVLAGLAPSSHLGAAGNYRSYVPYYQEPRYKRESDIDPETFLALLALYDERRNRDNDWRNYGIEEYEPLDDETAGNLIGADDEEPRVVYPQQQHRYVTDPLLSSELGRTRSSLYDQYLAQQQQQQQQYGDVSGAQYALPYSQHTAQYFPVDRKYISRKRSLNYDSYGAGRNGYILNSRSYPSYQPHRMY